MSMDITSATVFVDKNTELNCFLQKTISSEVYNLTIQEKKFKSHYISFYFTSKEQIIDLVDQLITKLKEVN